MLRVREGLSREMLSDLENAQKSREPHESVTQLPVWSLERWLSNFKVFAQVQRPLKNSSTSCNLEKVL